ncbi:MAG: decarboxylating 6-phosphogluconate dehydrogenase [Chloroflexi bacterium]|nr:decarboxylating 6-phosphogluconate dehydrogenase [Chloroflexota bacterium]MBI5291092.1 decarboxylating 6-phosphogluconate dehydrogenase [Chloroflexota bacterium]
MDIAMIGLGRMGGNMARRLLRGGHRVVLHNRSAAVSEAIQKEEGRGEVVHSLTEAVEKLQAPRHVWIMLPAGEVTEQSLVELMGLLSSDDTVIDGGNSNYKDTQRRHAMLKAKGLNYVDVGTSGGVWGLANGYGMMVGGDDAPVARLRPILETLAPAPDHGWGHMGPSGAGHYVKMVHNGIEYGMMQAFAEGFEIMRAKKDLHLNMAQIAEAWRYGTVIRSWLLDLAAAALKDDPELTDIAPFVADSGEGRWTVADAIDLDVPAPVITLALMARFYSRSNGDYTAKVLSAMRNQFGGHAVKKL